MAVSDKVVPVRRGVAKLLTLDHDAVAVLEALAPGPKTQGRIISELLRAEMCRREERQKAKEVALKAVEAALCP